MTKAEIIVQISDMTGLTKVETEIVVNGFLASVSNAMSKGETINFRGFGNFSVKYQKGRYGVNPNTKEKIWIGEKYKPVFKASKTLKEKVMNSKKVKS
ncbi:MAG: HU family DNA-binding protein [Candidatus Marinimicrobia bacterium]|nr:HU family DNA-binding protein [Candidatus Neomarinimicrobiota bacterium]